MAQYPDENFTPRTIENRPGVVFNSDDTKTLFAEDLEAISGEIVAIENALGLNPAGAYETVAEFLDALASAVAGKLAENAWVDISATSTIVGWSSFTNKYIRVLAIGKLRIVVFRLTGTSNSTVATFTLPTAVAGCALYSPFFAGNNGGARVLGMCYCAVGSSTPEFYKDPDGSTVWTASGAKTVNGQFVYEVA